MSLPIHGMRCCFSLNEFLALWSNKGSASMKLSEGMVTGLYTCTRLSIAHFGPIGILRFVSEPEPTNVRLPSLIDLLQLSSSWTILISPESESESATGFVYFGCLAPSVVFFLFNGGFIIALGFDLCFLLLGKNLWRGVISATG